jgi:acetyltransferase-like isoleucine patch superfamily enzyme
MDIKTNIKKMLGLKDQSGSIFTKDHFSLTKFKIGEYTYGVPRIFFINDEANLEIGKFCSISSGVEIFLGGNHRTDWITTYPFNVLNTDFPNAVDILGHPATKGSVKIMNDVWIGGSVTILSGVTIGNGAVLGNGSVITKDVGPYEIWVGNPARLVRKRFSDEDIKLLLELKWWDWSIDKINLHVKDLCSDNFDALRKIINSGKF